VPTVEGLQFHYALHPLPPGGWGFRRFRWELWHGAHLVAAGWRTTERDAQRALHVHASRVGHALFGLRHDPGVVRWKPFLTGATVRLTEGPVALALVPRALDQDALAVA
jgi:hypothetical protein